MIKIWRPIHVAFAAAILEENLQKLGFQASVVDTIDAYDDCLYIIYNAASVKRNKLPANYIVYQTEVPTSKWFNENYKKTLHDALAIWEYSPSNISSYSVLNDNIHVVTPGVRYDAACVERTLPLVFYGYTKKSQMRKDFLRSVSKRREIEIIEGLHSHDMWEVLKKTETILNVHYYSNAPLETFRINEALSFGCKIISQKSPNIPKEYLGLVEFVDTPADVISVLNEPRVGVSAQGLELLDNFSQLGLATEQVFQLRAPKTKSISRFFISNWL